MGGSYRPNGRWHIEGVSQCLVVSWYSWPETVLQPTPSGFASSDLELVEIAGEDPRYQMHRDVIALAPGGRGIAGVSNEGVCDRLTNMLLVSKIAKMTGRTPCWAWPLLPTCNCRFHELFEADSLVVSDIPLPLGPRIAESGMRVPGIIEAAKGFDSEPWLHLENGYYGHNYDGLDELVSPSREIQRLLRDYMNAFWSDRVVGVHIRRTDKADFSPSLQHYFHILDELSDGAGGFRIFLASDDPHCKELLVERYGKRVIDYPVRSHRRDVPEGIIDAVVCLYLLRRTQGVIGSKISGYSMCAGWDCGFVDVPAPGFIWNIPWSGERFDFRPVRLPSF
jgi:hypothetical protein